MAEQSFEDKLSSYFDSFTVAEAKYPDGKTIDVYTVPVEAKHALLTAHLADKQAYALEVLENVKALVLKDRTIFMTHKDVATMDEWMKTRQNLRSEIAADIDQAIAKVKQDLGRSE